jgi:hypothetical protein
MTRCLRTRRCCASDAGFARAEKLATSCFRALRLALGYDAVDCVASPDSNRLTQSLRDSRLGAKSCTSTRKPLAAGAQRTTLIQNGQRSFRAMNLQMNERCFLKRPLALEAEAVAADRGALEGGENAVPQPQPKDVPPGPARAAEHRPARACSPHLFHGWTRRRSARKSLSLLDLTASAAKSLGKIRRSIGTDATVCPVASSSLTSMRARGASCT